MKKILAFLLALILILGLAACSGGEGGPAAPDPENQGSGEPADPGDPARFSGQTLKIAAFEGGFGAQFWHELGDLFEAAYPGVTVEIQSNPKIADITRPQIVAGNYPDLYFSNANDEMYQKLIDEKLVEDLTDVFEQPLIGTDTPLRDMLTDGVLDLSVVKPYGDEYIAVAPNTVNSSGLYYNKTLFEKNGWEVPETWDEFFALGDAAREQGIALLAYPGTNPDYMEMMVWGAIASAAGPETVTAMLSYEEGSVSGNENVKAVLENVARIGQEGYLMEGTTALNHTQSQTEFMMDKALFMPNGNWLPNEMADAPRTEGFEFALAPSPKLSREDEAYYRVGTNGTIIPSRAENKELAREFLRFMYTDEAVRCQVGATLNVPRRDLVEIAGDLINPEVLPLFEIENYALPIATPWKPVNNSKVVKNDFVWAPVNDLRKCLPGSTPAHKAAVWIL